MLATHLGLDRVERRRQSERLAAFVDDAAADADLTMLLGDLNPLDRSESSIEPVLARFATALRCARSPRFGP